MPPGFVTPDFSTDSDLACDTPSSNLCNSSTSGTDPSDFASPPPSSNQCNSSPSVANPAAAHWDYMFAGEEDSTISDAGYDADAETNSSADYATAEFAPAFHDEVESIANPDHETAQSPAESDDETIADPGYDHENEYAGDSDDSLANLNPVYARCTVSNVADRAPLHDRATALEIEERWEQERYLAAMHAAAGDQDLGSNDDGNNHESATNDHGSAIHDHESDIYDYEPATNDVESPTDGLESAINDADFDSDRFEAASIDEAFTAPALGNTGINDNNLSQDQLPAIRFGEIPNSRLDVLASVAAGLPRLPVNETGPRSDLLLREPYPFTDNTAELRARTIKRTFLSPFAPSRKLALILEPCKPKPRKIVRASRKAWGYHSEDEEDIDRPHFIDPGPQVTKRAALESSHRDATPPKKAKTPDPPANDEASDTNDAALSPSYSFVTDDVDPERLVENRISSLVAQEASALSPVAPSYSPITDFSLSPNSSSSYVPTSARDSSISLDSVSTENHNGAPTPPTLHPYQVPNGGYGYNGQFYGNGIEQELFGGVSAINHLTRNQVTWGHRNHANYTFTHYKHVAVPASVHQTEVQQTVRAGLGVRQAALDHCEAMTDLASTIVLPAGDYRRRRELHMECTNARLEGVAVGHYRYQQGHMTVEEYLRAGVCVCWEECVCSKLCTRYGDLVCPCGRWIEVNEQ